MTGAPAAVAKPLTLRLLKRILGSSAVLILLLAAGWARWEYHTALDTLHRQFDVIEAATSGNVAADLWVLDKDQLAMHVESLRNFRHIRYAAVLEAGRILAQSGVRRSVGVLEHDFPLFITHNGKRQELGVLLVQADLQAAMQDAFRAALRVMAFNAALVLLVAGLVFWLTSSMISRHLSAVAGHFQTFSLAGEQPPQPLALDKKPAGDELDVLVQAVNTMQEGLTASLRQVVETQAEVRSMARFPQENPNPVLRARADGVILKANPVSAELFGSLGAGQGQRLPEPFASNISQALTSGEMQHFEAGIGGRVFAFTARPLPAEGFANLYGMDISRRVQAEEDLRRVMIRLESLVRVLQHETENVQEFLDHCLGEALTLTGSRLGYIYHYDEDRQEFVLNTWSAEVMAECAVKGASPVYQLDKTGIWGEAVRQRKAIVVNDFQAPLPLKRGWPAGHVRLHNFMTVPVFSSGEIVAVAGVGNKDGDYQDADVRQLSLLMEACWQVVGRLDAEGEVLRSLREKEILLKEIHHRVKNNLQIISSLLFLQAEYVVAPEDRVMFAESQKRISAMALVHEELYGSSDLSSVAMADYVPRLVDRVMASADITAQVEYDVANVRLPVTQSIPCGLVLNEMVMNAVKHAFLRHDGECRLRVALAHRAGQLELAVEDNGPGLPEDFDLESPATLGLTLITSLAQQLSGGVLAERLERGTRFLLRFPMGMEP